MKKNAAVIGYGGMGAGFHVKNILKSDVVQLAGIYDIDPAKQAKAAADGVKGYYPAFDITPPELVSGVVTDTGIYTPYDLKRYFADGNMGEYEMVI